MLLAVYGTLRAGGPAHHLLDGAPLVATGVVPGALYRVDWYPTLDLTVDGNTYVEVYELDDSLQPALDEYEGCAPDDPTSEYRRVEVDVVTGRPPSGGLRAWTYVTNRSTRDLLRVPADRWPI